MEVMRVSEIEEQLDASESPIDDGVWGVEFWDSVRKPEVEEERGED